jgi:sulfur carrier protein
MQITYNGRPREIEAGTTLGTLVDREVADRRGVAVAVDGEVVRRTQWDDLALTDGARIEVVGAVQGG